MQKITAIIPTFNEEANIKGAIESCLFADEIIVVDSFSTDNTLKIAREFSQVKVLEHEYKYSAAQKNWAIPQAEHNWIFLLDADERTSSELIKEIQTILKDGTKYSAFWIGRKNYFMDQELNYVWKGDAVIRLFKRDECEYEDKHVHAEVITEGKISRLKHKLKHDTYFGKGLDSHLRKAERYTTWAARDRVNKIKKIGPYHLLVKPFGGFIKRYIVSGGILDGRAGFIISCMGAWNIFIRNIKIWRMHKGEEFKD